MAASSPTLFQVSPQSRERVRRAIRELEADEGESLTLRRVTESAKVAKGDAAIVLRAYRAGFLSRDVAWDGSLVQEDLARRVQEATSDRERAQLCNDLAAALHLGLIEPVVGRAMGALIAEARQCDRAARESEGDTDAQPIYLLSERGIILARAMDFVISPELRAEAEAYVEDLVRRDHELFPNPTQAEVEALRAEGGRHDLV